MLKFNQEQKEKIVTHLLKEGFIDEGDTRESLMAKDWFVVIPGEVPYSALGVDDEYPYSVGIFTEDGYREYEAICIDFLLELVGVSVRYS